MGNKQWEIESFPVRKSVRMQWLQWAIEKKIAEASGHFSVDGYLYSPNNLNDAN